MKIGLIGISFILGYSLFANAAPVGCNAYRSPVSETLPYLQKIVYFDNNPQMCASDFLAALRNDKANAAKNALWEQALSIAKRNVRKLRCSDGREGNIVFINKKVFLTNAHAFYTSDSGGVPLDEQSPEYIHRCYVMNGSKRTYIDMDTPPDFGDPRISSGEDYAVGAMEDTIEDVESIEIANPSDLVKDQETLVASAYRDNAVGSTCFSAALCFDRRIWPATGNLASNQATNCPSDNGASGSAMFLISRDGKVVLGSLHRGGTNVNSTNGRPYFYTTNLKDPRAAYSDSIGIDGIFRQKIDTFVKEIESQNPPGSLVPQSHIRSANYGSEGQDL